MIRKQVITFLSVLLCLSACRQKIDCARYRTGTFFMRGKLSMHDYTIVRTETTQIETDHHSGKSLRFDVKWLAPCVYELTLADDQELDSLPASDYKLDSLRHVTSRVRIMQTGENYYIFEIDKEGLSFPMWDTIWLKNKQGH